LCYEIPSVSELGSRMNSPEKGKHSHESSSQSSEARRRAYPVRKPDKRVTRKMPQPADDRKMPGTDKQRKDDDDTPANEHPKRGELQPRSAPSLPTVSFNNEAKTAPKPQAAAQREATHGSSGRRSPLPPRSAGEPARTNPGNGQKPSPAAPGGVKTPSELNAEAVSDRTDVPEAPTGEETIRLPKDGAGTAEDNERNEPEHMYRADSDPSLAETQDMDPIEVEPPPEPTPGNARISFGQAGVNLKLVTPAQIQECVNVQRAMLQKGQRVPLLGQLLLQRGYIDKPAIERIKSYQQMYQISDKIPGYKLHDKLGQGAMGTVYKARQVRMERWVAIKVLQPELAANQTIKKRFLQEARASARLNHPNVITGIDAGEIEGLCYFTMEYVEGKTLQQLVRERGAMDERQALELIVQVAKALEHAEKLGLVHRDIKPDNIMVTRDRQVKLLDLGLAKVRADSDQTSSRGMAVGTPNYISPEQAMGRGDIDTRADIYSLGVTLYFCLTARVPFEGPPEVVMYRHIHEPPAHPKNYRPDLSDPACTLLKTMMAKRIEDRPPSAMQLVSDIEHLLRTGKLPGFFDSPASGVNLKVKKDSRVIVDSKRAPRVRGMGPPQSARGPKADGFAETPKEDQGPRLPRKRKKRFGGNW
jgi:eukaryotic-like serine/threonine-protein kinase